MAKMRECENLTMPKCHNRKRENAKVENVTMRKCKNAKMPECQIAIMRQFDNVRLPE